MVIGAVLLLGSLGTPSRGNLFYTDGRGLNAFARIEALPGLLAIGVDIFGFGKRSTESRSGPINLPPSLRERAERSGSSVSPRWESHSCIPDTFWWSDRRVAELCVRAPSAC